MGAGAGGASARGETTPERGGEGYPVVAVVKEGLMPSVGSTTDRTLGIADFARLPLHQSLPAGRSDSI